APLGSLGVAGGYLDAVLLFEEGPALSPRVAGDNRGSLDQLALDHARDHGLGHHTGADHAQARGAQRAHRSILATPSRRNLDGRLRPATARAKSAGYAE